MSILKMGPKSSPPAAPAAVGVAGVQAQLQKAGLSFTLYRPPQKRGQASAGGPNAVVPAGPEQIGGVTVGTAGSGLLAGFTLVAGEDFNDSLAASLVRPANPYGRVVNNFSERDSREVTNNAVGALGDQYWTGFQDLGDGLPMPTYADVVAESQSVLALKSRRSTTVAPDERTLNGPRVTSTGLLYTYRPMAWGCVTLFPDYATTGDHWMVIKWRYTIPVGMSFLDAANPSGAIWMLNIRGGSEAGNNPGAEYNDEFDMWEYHIGGGKCVTRPTSGGAGTPALFGGKADGTWNYTAVHFTAAQIFIRNYEDQGFSVLLGTASPANSATNLGQLFYLLLGCFNVGNNAADGSVHFDETAWVNKSALLEVDWVQEWMPAGVGALVPVAANLGASAIDFGGTGSIVLPSQAALWGQSVDTEYVKFLSGYDTNGPGRTSDTVAWMMTRDTLPVGCTYTPGTRTVAFDATFSAQAGVCHGYVYAQKAGFGVSRPWKFPVYVKPKLAIPALPAARGGVFYSYQIPRGSPRNWDNGNCPNGINSGLTLVSGPAWVSFDPVTFTISGTPPNNANNTLVFRCTNGVGLFTEQTVVIAGVVNQETLDYVSRMTTAFPTPARIALMDALYTSLKSGTLSGTNIYAKMDRLYLLKAHSAQAALLDGIHPLTTGAVTTTGGVTFTTDSSYATNGTNGTINMNDPTNPAGQLFTRNSCHIGIGITDAGQITNTIAGWVAATGIGISPRGATDLFAFWLNQASGSASTFATPGLDGSGIHIINRSGANATQAYVRGVAQTVSTNPNVASAAVVAHALELGLGFAGSFAAAHFTCYFVGGSLTANEVTDLYNALNTYLSAF